MSCTNFRIRLSGILCLLAVAIPSFCPGQVVYVDDDNTSGSATGTRQSPYPMIGQAIDAATSGDTIRVAAGEYHEDVQVRGVELHLIGESPDVPHIRGTGNDAVVSLVDARSSSLIGFRITGGSASLEDLPWAANGGGVYAFGGAPTIANNLIEQNDNRRGDVGIDETQGAGVYADEADITLIDNVIRNNVSGRGAGAALFGGDIVVSGNVIENNVGHSDHGGGLEIATPNALITRNLIRGNEIGRDYGYGWGGGVSFFNEGNTATFSHNVVTGNYAPTAGAGVFIDDGAEASFENELIYANECTEIGGAALYVDGIDAVRSRVSLNHVTVAGHDCPNSEGGTGLLLDVAADATITNSIFWGNGGDDFEPSPGSSLEVSFTDSDEPVPGIGNLSTNPMFVDPGAGDFHLRSTGGRWDPTSNGGAGGWMVDTESSPAIDAGDPAAPFSNEPQPNGSVANLGAFGNTPEASRSMTTTSSESRSEAPSGFVLHPNYPNPFNSSTKIRFEITTSGHIRVEIFDITGRRVRMPASGMHAAGYHEVTWDGKDDTGNAVAGGTYILRVRAGQVERASKMILLK